MRSVFVFFCARDFFGSLFFALIVLHGWGIESVALAANLPDAGMKIFEPQKMTPAQAKAMFNNRLIRRSSVAAPPKVSPRSATLVPAKGISASSSTTTATSAGTAIPSVDPNFQPEAIITRLGKTVTEPGGGVADFSASVTAQAVNTQAVSQVEPEIAELARALRYHPVLIWEYVYHNIEYAPVFGVTRGPLGTLLERKGNSFDQSALMVALLQESGYNARFVHGQIQLNAQQLTQWLGIKDDAPIADNYLRKMGIPSVVVEGLSNQIQSVQLEHVWVVVNYLGADYILDPSLKIHQITSSGINVAAAMGFDEAGFLASALSGATQTTDSIQNINRTKIQSSLQGYAQNLSDYIKTAMPAATLDDVLGGKQIKPALWGGWQTAHPYEVAGSTVEWPIIPDVYRRSLRIEYAGIDVTVYSDQVFCKRLTLFTNQASQPELRLDGVVLGTGTGITPGQSTALTLSVDLPIQDAHGIPYSATQTLALKGGVPYVIVNGWSYSAGRDVITKHRKRLAQFRYDGLPDTAEPMLGESLALFASTWLAETSRITELTDKITHDLSLRYHALGVVGFESGAFIDIPMERNGLVELDDALPRWESSFWTGAGFASAFEWGAIEQLQPTRAVSTIKLIDYAASLGQKIFDVTPGNWAAVQPQLVGYSALDIAKIQGFIDNGFRIILPENGSLVQDSWTGAGYIALGPNDDSIGHLITGGLKGGLSALLYDVKNAVKDFFFDFWDESFGSGSIFDNEQSQDPIDLVTGDLLYQHEDLTIGSAAFPYGLSLQRTYTSGARLLDGSMGLGWRHGFDISVRTDSDGFQGMGEDSPIDAAATIAGLYVAMDMYGAFTPGGTALTSIRNPERMLSAALVVRWTMDQLINNIVTVAEIGKTLQFVRLPDGTYNPPPGSASSLVRQANAGYLYRTAQGVTLDFDPSGLPVDWQHPNGARLSFSHTNGQLQSVANSFGRSATFSYSGGRVSSVTDDTGRSINYAYDNAGNLTTYTDAAGKVTTYAYDLPGRLTQIFTPGQPANAKVTNIYNALDQVVKQVDAAGNPWEYSFASGFKGEEFSPTGAYFTWYFDSRGNKITERNQVFQTTRYRYDGHNRVIRTEFPENNDVEYLYDANHNLVHKETHPKPPFVLPENIVIEQYTYDLTFNKMLAYTDPLGRVTTNTYDPQTGNLLTVTLPAVGGQSPQTMYAYNRQGQVLTETGPTGQVLRYTYDSVSGNLLSIINDAGRLNLTTQFGYDAVGNVITQTDPNGRTATLRYDARRRITSTFAAAPYNHETRFTYDDDDHLTLGQVATGDSANPWQVTRYLYNTADRLSQEMNPEGALKEYYYDYWGNIQVAYDEEYRKVSRFYDFAGRLAQVWDNLDQVQEEYSYTPNGQVESVADANNNVTRYNYDSLDRLSEIAFPDGSFERYTYDVAGNALSKTTRTGQAITWTYDALNRVKTKTLPGAPPVTYTYDLAGRQTRVTGTSGAINYGYDTAGRLTTVINADNKVLRYQYDAAGNRTRLTYSNNDFIAYTYDELNRLSAITDTNGTALARYRYDALSRRVSLTYGNGTQAEYRYEPDNDLSVLTNQFTANAVTFGYTHNKVHQRTRVDISNDAFAAWPSLNPSTTYTANALNQYTQVGGVQHSYDGNGNLSDDTVNTYVYDAENRLTQTTTPTATLDFAYDPLGRRIQKTVGGSTTKYLYDQNQVIEEFDSAGQRLRHYVYGPGLDQPVAMSVGSSRYYYHFDGLGSVVALSDATGTDVERYAYGPFGEDTVTRSALGNPYRYTARRFDEETGLYYYRARFYSTDLKRFLQPDPIGYSDGMNLYAYVGNDPLNFTDPTGQFKGDLRGEYYDLVSDELSEDDLRAEMEQMMGNFFPGGAVTTRTAFAFRSFARQLFDKAKARVSRFINPVTRGGEATAKELNQISHVFPRAEKGLEGLVRANGGSELAALRAVQVSADQALAGGKLVAGSNGVLPGNGLGAILNVSGVNVQLIGGRIVNGAVELGSFVGL